MTTDELIKQVLEHGDDGCFLHGECDTYQSAPLLARKLQRALESLRYQAAQDWGDDADYFAPDFVLDEIEEME